MTDRLEIRRPPSPLARRRLALGLTQGEVAERAGVGRKTVGVFERGGLPSLRIARKIAAALDSRVADLLPDDEDPAGQPGLVKTLALDGQDDKP